MTRRIGRTTIIEAEGPDVCELCAKVDELRPYGPGGKRICFDCFKRPENQAEGWVRARAMLEGRDYDAEN